MKLCLIINPKDIKLVKSTYSLAYRDQLIALISRFNNVQYIHESCSARDIEADIIIFYDPHSTHHIKIDGIKRHGALKYEFMDDPFQGFMKGRNKRTNQVIIKLGAGTRIKRVLNRGIDFIICPYTELYYQRFAPLLSDAKKMLVWFPPSPNINRYTPVTKLMERKREVFANGALHHMPGFKGYEFRKWAYKQPDVVFVPHCFYNSEAPKGIDYPKALMSYAGALALCDTHIPPKYIEIPMAGCVCFAQYQEDYERMGFKNGESCIYVDKENFADVIRDFKKDVSKYQKIADAGRKLIEENWTAKHFAEYIYNHAVANGK